MNAIDVVKAVETSRSSRAERKPARPERDSDDSVREAREARERFSRILELLAGTGSRVRAELLKQVPGEGASLLDRLLESAEADVDGDSGEGQTGALDPATTMRYGMLKQSMRSSQADIEPLIRENSGAELRGLHGIARAARSSGNSEVLARIAGSRGASLEELMARGDTKSADLKRALDELLSRAGSDETFRLPGSGAASELTAHATALAAAHARSASDVSTPVRDAEALAPEFRSRLDRVIQRMKDEYDHNVQVIETTRSQARQDHLYEQGRSRSGPVVTWTRESAHISGHAADVVIDDKWNNAEGFSRLHRIAREEGLRTLGMRDPGHLELPKELRTSATQDLASTRSNVDASTATVSSGVARVASVAQVASVARMGEVSSSHIAPSGMAPSMTAINAAAASTNSSRDSGTGSSTDRQASTSNGDGSAAKSGNGGARTEALVAPPIGPPVDSTTQPGQSVGNAGQATQAGAAAFDRAMEAQRVRDNAPAPSVSQLKLEVDAPGGGKDQITIGMRGNQVGTHIVTDAQNADRLRVRTGELQEALGKHGLESDSVRISSTRKEGTDSAKGIALNAERDATRLAGSQQSQGGDSASQHNQRDRHATTRDSQQEREEARRERDEQRRSEDERQRRGPFNPEF